LVIALEAATAHRSVDSSRRLVAFAVGCTLYALWMLVIRNGESIVPRLENAPVIAWALTLATVAISYYFALRPRERGRSPHMGTQPEALSAVESR